MPPSWGANALLHPPRRPGVRPAEMAHDERTFEGDGGVKLHGWVFHSAAARRGTVIYLHGLSDNRGSSGGLAKHLTARGYDVVAYDSRAHGDSGGSECTYGYYEKRDLARVIDALGGGPVILLGNSMGAGVALQAAAEDKRIAAVVAIATISDLRTAIYERAPFFATRKNIAEALRIAEERGKFRVDEVSPVAAAARIEAPVLLIHGASDDETPPAHSQRVLAALRGPKELLLVPGAGHSDALAAESWKRIDGWLDALPAAQKSSWTTTSPERAAAPAP